MWSVSWQDDSEREYVVVGQPGDIAALARHLKDSGMSYIQVRDCTSGARMDGP